MVILYKKFLTQLSFFVFEASPSDATLARCSTVTHWQYINRFFYFSTPTCAGSFFSISTNLHISSKIFPVSKVAAAALLKQLFYVSRIYFKEKRRWVTWMTFLTSLDQDKTGPDLVTKVHTLSCYLRPRSSPAQTVFIFFTVVTTEKVYPMLSLRWQFYLDMLRSTINIPQWILGQWSSTCLYNMYSVCIRFMDYWPSWTS